MIEKFGVFIDKKINKNVGYYTRCFIYIFFMLFSLALVAYFFNIWEFVFVGTIVMCNLRNYSGGYHAKNLEFCILLTTILFCIFGYISIVSIDYIWLIYIISLYSCKNIILKSPISETDYNNKSKEWHMKKVSKYIIIFIFLSFIFLKFNFLITTNCILLSIIMVDILLFSNYFNKKG